MERHGLSTRRNARLLHLSVNDQYFILLFVTNRHIEVTAISMFYKISNLLFVTL